MIKHFKKTIYNQAPSIVLKDGDAIHKGSHIFILFGLLCKSDLGTLGRGMGIHFVCILWVL